MGLASRTCVRRREGAKGGNRGTCGGEPLANREPGSHMQSCNVCVCIRIYHAHAPTACNPALLHIGIHTAVVRHDPCCSWFSTYRVKGPSYVQMDTNTNSTPTGFVKPCCPDFQGQFVTSSGHEGSAEARCCVACNEFRQAVKTGSSCGAAASVCRSFPYSFKSGIDEVACRLPCHPAQATMTLSLIAWCSRKLFSPHAPKPEIGSLF